MKVDLQNIDQILEREGKERKSVIPILQAIQKRYHYLPEEALRKVCDFTDITPEQIISVASFYSQFRLYEVGKHIIKVCCGTACHVQGSALVYEALHRKLELDDNRHTDAGGNYTLEKVHCVGCCALAPVVQIDQYTFSHLSSGNAEEILGEFTELKQKRALEIQPFEQGVPDGEIRVILDSCCVASGTADVKKAVDHVLAESRLSAQFKQVSCVGMCSQVPMIEIALKGQVPALYTNVQARDIRPIVEKHFRPHRLINRLRLKLDRALLKIQGIWPPASPAGRENDNGNLSSDARDKELKAFLGQQVPIATRHRGSQDPLDLGEYVSNDGFKALEQCLKSMTPEEVIAEVQASGLRGRGGAGFPTGKKWALAAAQGSYPKYVICNGDEGDPGAFMDRMLLESYPYRVIEGMLIAAFAAGADQGYFYIRAEYPEAVERIRAAIAVCEDAGWIGKNILDSDFSCSLTVYEGAGAFVCGEETALINSIEGDRGFPRIRPPFPVEQGLWGQPTLVNNTETLANIPFILHKGASIYNAVGTETSKGTKVFSLTGKVKNGGLIEVPMGTTIRQIVEDIGGGIANGRKFKAVQIGGPSGGCVPANMADIPIDYESLQAAGAMMGSGGLVVLDDTDCMVDMARYFLAFSQNESCGKCTFCRIGTKRMLEILDKICSGKGKNKDLSELTNLAMWTTRGSLCGLGKTAPHPVTSTLLHFKAEYEAHIKGICPTGKCQDLIEYEITDDCIGCTICMQKCPTDAIAFTPHIKHDIELDKCIRCDTCRQVCPYDAVTVH